MRVSLPVPALAATVLALAACTPAATPPSSAQPPATSASATQPSASQGAGSPAATTTVTASATTTATATATVTATSAAATRPSSTASRQAGEQVVNPADFKVGDRYLFVSPSGKIHCGGDATLVVGCQMQAPVPDVPSCPGDNAKQPVVYVHSNGEEHKGCTTQGIFYEQNAKTLPYGYTLRVPGRFTCVSQESGVTCASLAVVGGFKISTEGISI